MLGTDQQATSNVLRINDARIFANCWAWQQLTTMSLFNACRLYCKQFIRYNHVQYRFGSPELPIHFCFYFFQWIVINSHCSFIYTRYFRRSSHNSIHFHWTLNVMAFRWRRMEKRKKEFYWNERKKKRVNSSCFHRDTAWTGWWSHLDYE